MKYVILALAALTITGCGELAHQPVIKVNQEKRTKLFQECMKILPAGPISTHYNDWSEVVSECGSQAYYAALECEQNCETASVK